MNVVLTEGQLRTLLKEEVIMENFFRQGMTFNDILKTVKMLARKGVLTTTLIAAIAYQFGLNQGQRRLLQQQVAQSEVVSQPEGEAEKQVAATPKTREEYLAEPDGNWTEIADDVLATVYNATPGQCNKDASHTASMFKLNLDDVLSHRIIAMERTMMSEFGLKYGDVVKIEGAGKWDGLWRIEDTMNKRFAGQHKIDILVPSNVKYGKWSDVKVYVPQDEETKNAAKQVLG